MKREKDLCLKILQFIEKNQTSYEHYLSDDIKIDNYTDTQIIYHLDLLEDNMLVEIDDSVRTMGSSWRRIKRITNAGHDFLDDVRE